MVSETGDETRDAARQIEPAQRPKRPFLICLGLFVLANLLLSSNPWFLDGDALLIAMALPLSQCSLIALWAAVSGSSPYLRFAAPTLVVVASWYVLTRILPWGIGDPVSAAWAIALATQTLVIIVAILLYKDVRTLVAKSEASDANPSLFRFNIQTLILWTTVIALGFAFVQFGQNQWLWTADIADWDFIKAIPFIGVFNAFVAVMWLWALGAGSWRWRGTKSAIVLLLIGLLGISLSKIVFWIAGIPGFSVHETMVIATAQSCMIAGALAFTLYSVAGRQSRS